MHTILPLLRLPFLALEKCIQLMDLEDQFSLSNVSKRSQRIVKCCVRNQKYEATLTFEEGEFKVEVTINDQPEKLHYLDLEDADLDSIKRVIAQFTNAFSLEELSLDFQEGHTQLLLDVIPFVKEQGVKMGTVYVGDGSEEIGSPYNDKLCEFIFKECKHAKGLDLGIPTTPKFYLKLNRFGPYRFNMLGLCSSLWVTMNHVLRWFWECEALDFDSCTFTCRDINRFMREWIKGSAIRSFIFTYDERLGFSLAEALRGIPNRQVHRVRFQRGTRQTGYVIRQEDGTEAFVCVIYGICLDLSTKFEIDPMVEEEEDEEAYY